MIHFKLCKDHKIKKVTIIKFLGMGIDRYLDWKIHHLADNTKNTVYFESTMRYGTIFWGNSISSFIKVEK
jgi:hypothetical protein